MLIKVKTNNGCLVESYQPCHNILVLDDFKSKQWTRQSLLENFLPVPTVGYRLVVLYGCELAVHFFHETILKLNIV